MFFLPSFYFLFCCFGGNQNNPRRAYAGRVPPRPTVRPSALQALSFTSLALISELTHVSTLPFFLSPPRPLPVTLRMSYPLQTNNNSPRHIQQAQEDDGHPDDDGLEYVNSRIRGLEAFASPEARNKVLPWLDEVPRGGKPEDERSFAGGSMRTAGGILKRESTALFLSCSFSLLTCSDDASS